MTSFEKLYGSYNESEKPSSMPCASVETEARRQDTSVIHVILV